MSDKRTKTDRARHLQTAAGYFAAWVIIAYFMITTIKDGGGISYIVSAINEGNYVPIILIASSVTLFALALKYIFQCLTLDSTSKHD